MSQTYIEYRDTACARHGQLPVKESRSCRKHQDDNKIKFAFFK